MIRPIHPDDAERLWQLFAKPSLLACDHFEPAADLSAFHAFADRPSGNQHRLVLEKHGRLVAVGILSRAAKPRLAHSGRLHLLLPPSAQPEEDGVELVQALIALAEQWLNLSRLEIDIPAGATGLEKSLQESGFVVEGIMKSALFADGRYHDGLAMARLSAFAEQAAARPAPSRMTPAGEQKRLGPSEISIRPIREEDVDDLYEVFRAPQNCLTTLQLPSQELWLTRQRVLEPSAGMLRLVAVVDQHVVGMISLRRRAPSTRSHVAGLGMMVHTDYWGQGIGSQLMAEALDLADRWLNLKRVELQVHTDNPAALHLYEKFGFVTEGTKRLNNFGGGGWADTFFMARINHEQALLRS